MHLSKARVLWQKMQYRQWQIHTLLVLMTSLLYLQLLQKEANQLQQLSQVTLLYSLISVLTGQGRLHVHFVMKALINLSVLMVLCRSHMYVSQIMMKQ